MPETESYHCAIFLVYKTISYSHTQLYIHIQRISEIKLKEDDNKFHNVD